MGLVFYTLASIALIIHLVEKTIELFIDYKEVKGALKIRKATNKILGLKNDRYDPIDCPIHKLVMYYHPPTKRHACQNITCKYARGIRKENLVADIMGSRE